jgi:dUTPase
MQVPVIANSSAFIPTYSSSTGAADLIAETIAYDKDHGNIVYSVGLSITVPHGYEAHIRARTDLAESSWYMPCPIVLDSSYSGPIKVKFTARDRDRNIFDIKVPYAGGKPCAQLVFVPVIIADFTSDYTQDQEPRTSKGLGTQSKLKLSVKKEKIT